LEALFTHEQKHPHSKQQHKTTNGKKELLAVATKA